MRTHIAAHNIPAKNHSSDCLPVWYCAASLPATENANTAAMKMAPNSGRICRAPQIPIYTTNAVMNHVIGEAYADHVHASPNTTWNT